jgi:hypothetical protein
MSIATKVMIQIASKLGEELWRVLVPNTVTENNVFFVFFFFFFNFTFSLLLFIYSTSLSRSHGNSSALHKDKTLIMVYGFQFSSYRHVLVF